MSRTHNYKSKTTNAPNSNTRHNFPEIFISYINRRISPINIRRFTKLLEFIQKRNVIVHHETKLKLASHSVKLTKLKSASCSVKLTELTKHHSKKYSKLGLSKPFKKIQRIK